MFSTSIDYKNKLTISIKDKNGKVTSMKFKESDDVFDAGISLIKYSLIMNAYQEGQRYKNPDVIIQKFLERMNEEMVSDPSLYYDLLSQIEDYNSNSGELDSSGESDSFEK